ncbi:MAG: hypothetical protein U0X73_00230 [Thermoanaerobaculia bacterium]
MTSGSSLVSQVLSGESRELQLLAAQGILPLPIEELLPLQVALAASERPEISGFARQALSDVEPSVIAGFLAAEAPTSVLAWFLRQGTQPEVLAPILRRRDVPRELLQEVAPRLSPDLQEVLLLRQDAILELPAILDALGENPRLSLYAKRRIGEYREHLLPHERKPVAKEIADLAVVADLTPEEISEIERVKALPHEGEMDERTGLSEGQIRALTVPVRVKLSRGAGRTLRNILVKDTNQMVAVSVLTNSAFSDEEIERVASNRQVVDEVLATIARRRDWVSNYAIGLALVKNPKLAVGVAVRLVSRLGVRDLKILMRDRNVSDGVRATAERLYRIKSR